MQLDFMIKKNLLFTLAILAMGFMVGGLQAQTTYVVSNSGLNFTPADITIQEGDTVDWQIASNHNVVEVSQMTHSTNGTAALPGGFSLPFGGGKIAFDNAGTYYYVCVPHASASMKGTITVTAATQSTPATAYVANLRGAQEVPSVVSPGFGQVEIGFRNDSIFVSGELESLSAPIDNNIGMHIHEGPAGSNGGVIFPLVYTTNAGGTGATILAEDNGFPLSPAQVETLNDRGFYVNVHTEAVASGEIRGQIQPIDGQMGLGENLYSANLYGSNEVPSIMTTASGAIVLDLVEDTLTVSGSFSGLSSAVDENIAGGAHLHIGLAGQNGPVELILDTDLDPDGRAGIFPADSNKFTLTATQKELLQARSMYLNLHTLNFGGGELRGQVVQQPLSTFRSFLAGAQEVPSVLSGASGEVIVELFPDSIKASGSFSGLGSDYASNIGSHIHQALAGSNGPVLIPLNPEIDNDSRGGIFGVANNIFAINATQVMAMLDREFYVNIHSVGSPSGEIRGQIVPESNFFLYALLSGTQEVSPVFSLGSGAGILEINGGQGIFSGSFNNLGSGLNESIAGGIHIHAGYAGQNGPVEIVLNFELNAMETSGTFAADSNVYSLASTFIDTLARRKTYVNIHSDNIASGELRGQLLGEAQNYFFAPLSGTSEPSPVNSAAFGNVAHEWLNGTLRSSGSFSNLGSELDESIAGGAHLHAGLAGQNGPLIYLLNSELTGDKLSGTFLADSNVFELTAGQTLDTLIKRKFYINIHSLDNGGGEIRGQVLPPAQAYFTTSLSGRNETTPNNSGGIGGLKLELIQDTLLTVSGAFIGLDGDFDESVAGGAHLHAGNVGSNGGIELILNSELAGDLKSGGFEADSNLFDITNDQQDLLTNDGLYANIHTTTFGAGELRGQILGETNSFVDSASMITGPGGGTTVSVEGGAASAFTATWDATTDPDGNPLAYIWELSASSDFSSNILEVNVGDNTNFTTDFATVDSILNDAGLSVGDSILLYHRATAIDGAVGLVGEADSVFLKRGNISVSNEGISTEEVSIYPSPTVDNVVVDLELENSKTVDIRLFTLDGKEVYRASEALTAGKIKTRIQMGRFPSGIYQLMITDEQGNRIARKVVKR